MDIDLDETRIQVALGTFNTEDFTELYRLDDKDLLTFLATHEDVTFRRAVASNPHTPFRVVQKMYREDTDLMVKECAWERVKLRYTRRFYIEPPPPPWKKIIDPYDIPE